jgi:glycosyltransferase involved in cell wall biosynthesis
MLKAFPTARLYTSLYLPDGTFPEFRWANVQTLPLDRLSALRHHHRLALPVLAPAFAHLRVDADVVLCSSSGWAHGVQTQGHKVVYCHAPARWLYQPDRYIGNGHPVQRGMLRALAPSLRRWDWRAAHSASRYLTQCQAVRERIRSVYGIDAEILPAPFRLTPEQPRTAITGVEPGFFLCVSRLLPYKNVRAVIEAFAMLPSERLVVAGDGPEASKLRHRAPSNVTLVGTVDDERLAWLYAHSIGVIASGYEDYGLTALEAAAFGKPTVALRFGGFLDTVRDNETGVFFDVPDGVDIRRAVHRLKACSFDQARIRQYAHQYSEEQFVRRLREVVREEDGVDRPA